MNEIVTTSQLWENFDTSCKSVEERERVGNMRRLAATVGSEADGEIVVEIDLYCPDYDHNEAVLLLGDFAKRPQDDVVEALRDEGYTVAVIDYTGVFEDTYTVFPPSKEYGYFYKNDYRLYRIGDSVDQNAYYLYTVTARRAITALKTLLPKSDIAVVGLRRGTEIALQTVGTDDRPIGLALIAGAGYREYVDYPKYGSNKVLSVEGELMQWITAVSGTAYAKRVKVPTIIAVGSNGTESDIDRVPALSALIQAPVSVTVSAGYRDNIDKEAFNTVLMWLKGTFLYSQMPKCPTLAVNINSEGELYGEVTADVSLKIKEVKVWFCYGDNNHSTRFWREAPGEYIGSGGYIARLRAAADSKMLFAYAEVVYSNGTTLDGGVTFVDLADKKIKSGKTVANPIVFQHPDENGFLEISDDTVILESSLKETALPIGLKGLSCDKGGMVSYAIGTKTGFDETRLLQIDTYSAEKSYLLRLCVVDGDNTEYFVSREIESTETFFSLLLAPNAFKDKNMQALDSWEGVKSLTVLTSGVTVGKIMFI